MTLTAGSPSSASHPARPGGAGAPWAAPPPGWYPDPTGHAPLRQWNGRAWSEWVSDGVSVRHDPGAVHRKLDAADLPHLDFVERIFLPDALATGCVTPEEEARLERLLDLLRGQATASAAAPPTSVPAVARPAPLAAPLPVPAPAPRIAPTTPTRPAPTSTTTTPRPPSGPALWWSRTREAVGSDLAVHGLAYVGVLLLLVGAFGLVVFAFGDVEVALRPVAELAIALAPFGAAALLLHRGATVVGRALEVAGGLLVPVMVITGFLDDSTIPPTSTAPSSR